MPRWIAPVVASGLVACQPAAARTAPAEGPSLRVIEDRVLTPLARAPERPAYGSRLLAAAPSVAVLDTGLDWTRPEFGACVAPGAPGCRVVWASDVASDDGALDREGHGTNVAAIIAGTAPEVGLVSLDVVDLAGEAQVAVVEAAVAWCIAHAAEFHLVAINLTRRAARQHQSFQRPRPRERPGSLVLALRGGDGAESVYRRGSSRR